MGDRARAVKARWLSDEVFCCSSLLNCLKTNLPLGGAFYTNCTCASCVSLQVHCIVPDTGLKERPVSGFRAEGMLNWTVLHSQKKKGPDEGLVCKT